MNINEKFYTKAIIVILLLSIVFTAGNWYETVPSNQNNKTINNTVSTITPQVKRREEELLNEFTGGFIGQGSNGDPSIQYFIQNPSMAIGFGKSSVKMLIRDNNEKTNLKYTEISLTFPNSNPAVPIAIDPIVSHSTYFIGSSIGTTKQEYSTIIYKNLYDHINLEYTIKNGELKYNFQVNPGGNPSVIQQQWHGPVTLQNKAQGMQITVTTHTGQQILLDKKPVSVQPKTSNSIKSEFLPVGPNTYGFKISNYNSNNLLIIDPTFMLYSTFLGGSATDYAFGMAMDSFGNIYVTGATLSTNFPAENIYLGGGGGGGTYYDVFIFKFSADGSSLVYSTYIGGSSSDEGQDIAVDGYGNAYVTGYTASSDFPTTSGAYQGTYGGGAEDAFVVKLSLFGVLSYSTYLGGSGYDLGFGIAVDFNGNAVVTGDTNSLGLATAFAFQTTAGGGADIFVAKFSSTGARVWFSYYGGTGQDVGSKVALGKNGYIYVTGYTTGSLYFPYGGIYTTYGGGPEDAFVFVMFPNGEDILYSTYLGGSGADTGNDIAVLNGYCIVTGQTDSSNFPTVSAYNGTYGGYDDIFVTEISSSGLSLVFSTYLGGSSNDVGQAIALDNNGNMYITGQTSSSNFPVLNAYNKTYSGVQEMFVMKLSSRGSLVYSSYVGGAANADYGEGIAVNNNGLITVVGYSYSSNYPVVNAYQKTLAGSSDVVISTFVTQSQQSLTPTNGITTQSNSSNSLEIIWNQPSYMDLFLHYNIYRGTTSGVYSLIGTSTDSHFVDNSITPGVIYHYAVAPVYSFGTGFKSADIVGVFQIVPSAPSLYASAGNFSVYLNWTAPNSDGGSTILKYEVFRGTQSGQYSFTGVTKNLYFNDTNLIGGTKYYYVVDAVNAIGEGTYSVEITATTTGISSNSYSSQSTSSSNNLLGPQNFEILGLVGILIALSAIVIVKRRKK